jgi:hypothetical protein
MKLIGDITAKNERNITNTTNYSKEKFGLFMFSKSFLVID